MNQLLSKLDSCNFAQLAIREGDTTNIANLLVERRLNKSYELAIIIKDVLPDISKEMIKEIEFATLQV